MPEPELFTYTHRELAELMIRERGINSGHWMVFLRFRQIAANFGSPEGEVLPGVLNLVDAIGLQRAGEAGPLSVDASALTSSSGAHIPSGDEK